MTILNNNKVLIIDSGIANIGSLYRVLKSLNYSPIVSRDKKNFLSCKNILLPGVGSFSEGMNKLIKYDLKEHIISAVQERGIPLLGICLGMQMLATIGFENEKTKGLNLIPGKVKKLEISKDYRIPHIGWNEVIHNNSHKLFFGIPKIKDFYFVHSYYFDVDNKNHILGTTSYDVNFPSIINKDNIYGFQFHPEKSQKFGMKLLENFLNLK